MQVGPIIILVLSISLYGFAKPYQERLANILELIVQFCFLLLLLLMSVASTQDAVLKLPEDGIHDRQCSNRPDDVAGIAWLLFPVLYFPHGLFLVVGGTHVSHLVWYVILIQIIYALEINGGCISHSMAVLCIIL